MNRAEKIKCFLFPTLLKVAEPGLLKRFKCFNGASKKKKQKTLSFPSHIEI